MWRILILADTHFNHEAMKTLEHRPLNYDALIKSNWKKLVKPEDTIIHLGDVILARASELKDILADLPGTKILVKGNHDWHGNNWYLEKWFNFVCDKIEMTINNINVIFTHAPIWLNDWEINIHGHWHMSDQTRYSHDNLSEEWFYSLYSPMENNFKPVLLDNLVKNAKKKKYL